MKKFKLGLVLLSLALAGCSSKAPSSTTASTGNDSTAVSETNEGSTETVAGEIGHKGDTVTTESGVQVTLDDVIVTNEYSIHSKSETSQNGNLVLVLLTIYNDGNSEVTAYEDHFTFSKGEKEYECVTARYSFCFNSYENNGITYDVPASLVYDNGKIQPEETYHYLIIGDLTEATSTDSELMVHFEDDTISYADPSFASFYLNQ